MPGPVPKRSDQRRRRNKTATTKATADGEARGPRLIGRHSAVATRFYEALRRSGQARFYEPSDWAAAELAVLAIDQFVKKPSAMMLQTVQSLMTNLLATEGDRRRVHLELERAAAGPTGDPAVALLDEFRRRSG